MNERQLVYNVYAEDCNGIYLLYLSVYKHRALEWAKEYYNNTNNPIWIMSEEIDITDFEICSFNDYIPQKIIFELGTENYKRED